MLFIKVNMSDDCDEIDVLGKFELDLESMSAPVAMTDNNAESIDQGMWSLEQNQEWFLDRTVDEKSRQAIEKMLRQDKTCTGMSGDVHLGDETCLQENMKRKQPPSLLSNKKPWSEEEKRLFFEGLETFGRKWTKIAQFIGTRSTLQVKNFARQYFKNQDKLNNPDVGEESQDSPLSISSACNSLASAIVSVTTAQSTCSSSSEADVVAKFPSGATPYVGAEEIIRISRESGAESEEDIDICEDNSCFLAPKVETGRADEPGDEIEFSVVAPDSDSEHRTFDESRIECGASAVVVKDEDSSTAEDNTESLLKSEDCSVVEECGDSVGSSDDNESQIVISPPTEEIDIDKDSITEEEKLIHKEFFEDRPQKTPDRYLKIRTFIIDSWKKRKPAYLNKTSVRPGLKNCGDVNCIGRIHEYLEQIGAINFGCEQARYNRPQTITSGSSKERLTRDELLMLQSIRKESMRPRKRKQSSFRHDTVYSINEGYTIEHDADGGIVETIRTVSVPVKSKQSKVTNPFKLVPCARFSTEDPEPFGIRVNLEAVIIADVHCHMVHTEVMGLLGGRFDRDDRILHVLTCESCDSLSTGVQCEMDPVSQTVAMEALQRADYQVVGWYHSHPTFVPDPSLRDIETQKRFQDLFDKQGANPFVAMIISPFYRTPASPIRYLIVKDDEEDVPVPFMFGVVLSTDDLSVDRIVQKAESLIVKVKSSSDRVDMMGARSNSDDVLTYLDITLNSLRHNLQEADLDEDIIENVLTSVNRMILQHCCDAGDGVAVASERRLFQDQKL